MVINCYKRMLIFIVRNCLLVLCFSFYKYLLRYDRHWILSCKAVRYALLVCTALPDFTEIHNGGNVRLFALLTICHESAPIYSYVLDISSPWRVNEIPQLLSIGTVNIYHIGKVMLSLSPPWERKGGCRGIASLIFNLGARCDKTVNFTLRPL